MVERAKESSESKKSVEQGRRKRKKEVKKLVRENLAPHTYIFQCVQKTSVPKCNIIKAKR